MSDSICSMMEGRPAIDPSCPVFHFDFAPVIERSLSLAPERIHLICEPCIRQLAPYDIVISRDRGFFLVVQSCSGAAADALAHKINTALLERFFGSDTFASGLDTIFRRAHPDEIEAYRISLGKKAIRRARPEIDTIGVDPLAQLSKAGMPGCDGLKTGFLPLLNLKTDKRSIYVCGAIRQDQDRMSFGLDALSGMSSRDRAYLDEVVLDYALRFVRQTASTSIVTAFAATVSFETLAWSRGRQLYQRALRAADVAENPFFLIKIEDVPPGVPAARLAEIVAVVRPFARVAVAQQALACLTHLNDKQELTLARSAGIRFVADISGARSLENCQSLAA
jgi:hypothetical protein